MYSQANPLQNNYLTNYHSPLAIQKTKGLFYESHSRFISLKRVSEKIFEFAHMEDPAIQLKKKKVVPEFTNLNISEKLEKKSPYESLYYTCHF